MVKELVSLDQMVQGTTMLNILNQDDTDYSGELKVGQTVKIAYFKQTEETLDRDIRMIDYLREESEVAKEKDGTSVSVTVRAISISECYSW